MLKNKLFWLIFIPCLTIIFFGWYFTTYKTIKLGQWNLSDKIDTEIWSGLNQDLKNIADSLNDIFKQADLPRRVKAGAQNNSTSTENVLIEKIKTKINQ